MSHQRSTILTRMLAVAALAALPGCGRGTSFPNRPLLIVCPWATGGGTDRVSRQVGILLEQEIGQPVNVVNATGGAGCTGHSRGARARPDGYTLTMITVELNMLHWQGLTDLTYEDFTPLYLLNQDAAALFVLAESPWQTLGELTADIARRKEVRGAGGAVDEGTRKLLASGTAKGGIWHLAVAGWLTAAGFGGDEVVWIPHNGAGPSLQDLLAGSLDMVCSSLPEATTVSPEKFRCLGVMAPERLAEFPAVPTFVEQGVDWSLAGWRGLGLPRGVARDRFAKLHDTVERVVQGEAFRAFMRAERFDARSQPAPDFLVTLRESDERLGGLLGTQFRDLAPDRFGPLYFPAIVGGVFLVALVALLLGRLRRGPGRGEPGPADEAPVRPSMPAIGRAFAAAAFVVVFAWCVEPLGYMLTTAALLFALLLVLRNRPLASLASAVLFSLISYEVFGSLFRLPLPRGLFGW